MGGAMSEGLIFRAPPRSAKPPARVRDSFMIWDERPRGSPGGGVRRPFLWLPGRKAPRTLIFFHGNAEDVGLVEDDLSQLRDFLGVNVLAVEYPGYGLLQEPGIEPPSVEAIDAAAVHALRYVVATMGIPTSQVLLHGRSLGSGPALRLAKYARDHFHWSVGAIILQCAFVSIRQVVADLAGVPLSFLVPPFYDNAETLRELCSDNRPCFAGCRWVPLLILHGEQDTVIPPYHGRALYSEARRLGHPWVQCAFSPHATHNRWDVCLDLAAPISAFLAQHMDGVAGPGRPGPLPEVCTVGGACSIA